MSVLLAAAVQLAIASPPASFASHTSVKGREYASVAWYLPSEATLVSGESAPSKFGLSREPILRFQPAGAGTQYTVSFADLGSDDPAFCVTDAAGSEIGCMPGTTLYLKGTNLYVSSGSANSAFDERRKFRIVNGTLSEVMQPMLAVGQSTTTLVRATLRQDPRDDATPVAVLPAEAPVTLLAARESWYLVQSSFGLLGWVSDASSCLAGGPQVFADFCISGD